MGQVADQVITDRYALYNGDSMDVMGEYPDGCMHGVVYSPPFAYGDEGLAAPACTSTPGPSGTCPTPAGTASSSSSTGSSSANCTV